MTYYLTACGHVTQNSLTADDVPVVVISPEDREQVERLHASYMSQCGNSEVSDLQAALRSLITPPKPEEPTGLGAVVEDVTGRMWVRAGGIYAWVHTDTDEQGDEYADACNYDDIAAIAILSKGVTS